MRDLTMETAWPLALQYLTIAWAGIKQFIDSSFFTSAVVALAGALVGAKTAQGTADRNRFRDDIVKEIRDTNAAISLSYAICNSVMAIKRQNLRRIKGDFERERLALIEHQRKRKTGEIQGDKPYESTVALMGLPVPSLPTDTLRARVLDRLSVVGRPLNLAVSIAESSAALVEATSSRNEQIKVFKAAGGTADNAFMTRYFGLPTRDGHVDQVYRNTLDAMVLHTDCVIFFTYLLCADLKEHADNLVKKYKRRLGKKGVPRVSEVDFSHAKLDQLIPSNDEFASWFTAFVKHPEPVSRFERAWQALRARTA